MSSSAHQSLLDKIAQLVHYSLRPLPPRFGDGRYNSDVFPEPTKTGILKDLTSQVTRVPADVDLIVEVIEMLYRGGLQNDAQYTVLNPPRCSLVFFILVLMSRTPLTLGFVDGEDYPVCCFVAFDFQLPGKAHRSAYHELVECFASSSLDLRRGSIPIPLCRWIL